VNSIITPNPSGPPTTTTEIKRIKTDGTIGTYTSPINGVPSWSADGSKVAWFSETRVNLGPVTTEIKVANADGTNAITVVDTATIGAKSDLGDVALNADGTKLAFSAKEGVGLAAKIWVVPVAPSQPLNASTEVVVGAPGSDVPTNPVFSADGKLAFLSPKNCGGNTYNHIWVLASPTPGAPQAGTELTRTCEDGSGGTRELVQAPISWSPDGTKIPNAGRVYVIAATNLTPKVQVYEAASAANKVKSTAWSPDGTKIAFTEGTISNTVLKVINADGSGSASTLTTEITDEVITWGPNIDGASASGSGGSASGSSSSASAASSASTTFTLKVAKTVTLKRLASTYAFTVPKGAVLSATTRTKKICTVSKTKVKGVKAGTCRITLKAKPAKGPATTKKVGFAVVK
jgi:Tol biopolymer transport system component